jgi:hypothetical protein
LQFVFINAHREGGLTQSARSSNTGAAGTGGTGRTGGEQFPGDRDDFVASASCAAGENGEFNATGLGIKNEILNLTDAVARLALHFGAHQFRSHIRLMLFADASAIMGTPRSGAR